MALRLLTGTFESTLDDKGRVVIPATLRDHYDGELVITQGKDFYVWIMTGKDYEKFLETLKKSASSLEEYSAYQYQFEAPAKVTEIDKKTGRIPVPAAIRSYANLSRDCLVLSINGRLEIWNADTYRAHMQEMQQTAKEAMKKLGAKDFFSKEGEN